jgi:Sulfatase
VKIKVIQFSLTCFYILGSVMSNFERHPTPYEWCIATVLILLQVILTFFLFKKTFNKNNAAWILSIIFTLWTYSYETILFELSNWNIYLAHLVYFSIFPFLYTLGLKFRAAPLVKSNKIFTIGMLLYGCLGIYNLFEKLKKLEPNKQVSPNIASKDSTNRKPNIYLFLLDAYAGENSLKKVLNFDNSPFIDSLKKKDFYVFEDSKSNYTSTIYSMTSFFTKDTLPQSLLDTTDRKANRVRLNRMMNILASGNTFVSEMRKDGYNVSNLSLFNISGCPPQYPRLFYPNWNSFWIKSIYQTFYGSFLNFLSRQRWIRNYTFRPEYVGRQIFNDLDSIVSSPSMSPKFVYLHSLAIHSPFIEVSNAQYKTGFWECLMDNPLVDKEQKYLKALKSLNLRVLKSINHIIEKDENSIILIFSDHSARFFEDSLLKDNFMAFYHKRSNKEDLKNIKTPVELSRYLNAKQIL